MVTLFIPTTRIDVYRDTDTEDTNVFGDGTETGTAPILINIPAAVGDRAIGRNRPVDVDEQRVEQFPVRVSSTWGIQEGDRLVDRRTRQTYLVGTAGTAGTGVGVTSARLVCTRVGV